jgi:hypothetical protein
MVFTLFGVAFSLGCVIWEKSWKWHDENKAEEEAKATKNQAAGDKAAKAKADLEAALKEDAKAAQTRRENISKRAYALGQMAVQDTPFGIRDLQQRISDAVASRVNRDFGASEGGLSDADALKGAQEAAKEAIKTAYMEVNNSAIFAGMGPFVPMMSPDELEKCANDILLFTLLYFTLLYLILLYSTLLYFTLLYFTLLYFTLLYLPISSSIVY